MGTKVGILGSGIVAKTLGEGFEKHNYQVRLGSRSAFHEIASWADLIVLAVRGTVALSALELAQASNLSGKTIIDVTNPIADISPTEGVLKFFTSLDQSLMETLQDKYPQAHFVKAFSSVGSGRMVNPDYGSVKPTMFICGNNADAKTQVTNILQQFGWETEDMGTSVSARAIEPLCILWCIPGFRSNQWTHAFKLLKN